jgi:hypothetical protein
MELAIALVLFIGMIVCWLMLPGSTSPSVVYHEADVATQPAAQQVA